MKFANYNFNARETNDLGDNMQIIALDEIYKHMGILQNEIVYIDKNELSSYSKEYVILPVILPQTDYTENGICNQFSSHIIPVFLCLILIKNSLTASEVEYYHKYEPIGCRDERTMQTLRRYGILCYLHGCITALMQRRKANANYHKVFIVDVPEKLEEYIPQELKKNSVKYTHFHSKNHENPKRLMQKYYCDYKNEASLIITSLLHCASPCIAAGIPVIIAKSQRSFRFAWIDKLVPIYLPEEFSKIDWYPEPVEYEAEKLKILDFTVQRIRDTFNRFGPMMDISYFYESRSYKEYEVEAFYSIRQFIDRELTDRLVPYKYAIWGPSQVALLTVQYLKNHCPNAILKHVYDTYKQVIFEGILTINPNEIEKYPDEIVFVTATSIKNSAIKLFQKIEKNPNTYAIMELVK